LLSIQRIFFLSYNIKVQFFKTFILPHFDYCSSLCIYFTDSIINQIESFFNFCIFRLLKLDLKSKTLEKQMVCLSEFEILPYKYRCFFRLCIFFHKIMNDNILNELKKSLKPIVYQCRYNNNLYTVPKGRTLAGTRRISIFLPECMNVIFRNSYMIRLRDFRNFIIFNLVIFLGLYEGLKLKFKSHFVSTNVFIDSEED
jgi:hypothetical protein